MIRSRERCLVLSFSLLLLIASVSPAADHNDGPHASMNPAADITDVFAWMSPDSETLNLVMAVTPDAGGQSTFSDALIYRFRTESMPTFGAAPTSTANIDCTFDPNQTIRCRLGNLTVSGDANDPEGIATPGGALRVFAGLRNDPFFFNLTGFQAVTETVAEVAGDLTLDAAGCPALDPETAAALVTQLQTEPGGGVALDDFAGLNVLAIVLSVDKDLLTRGGPIVSVWGQTVRR